MTLTWILDNIYLQKLNTIRSAYVASSGRKISRHKNTITMKN